MSRLKRHIIGQYVKTENGWAEQATTNGKVPTKEGFSHYQIGDYLVFNNEDGTDSYCVNRDEFEAMYELNS